MNNTNDITSELKSLGSSLAGLSRAMPYAVPSGYFQSFIDNIGEIAIINHLPEPQPGWSKTMPYVVPNGYFEQFAAKAAQAALGSKVIPFQVPSGYFATLPQHMLAVAKAAGPVKQSRIINLVTFSRLRWVAAAVLLICIGFGSYQLYHGPVTHTPEQMLASVTGNDIHEYLAHNYRVDVDRVVSDNNINRLPLDNKDIIQYLDETGWDVVD